jgi:hypothetical protein
VGHRLQQFLPFGRIIDLGEFLRQIQIIPADDAILDEPFNRARAPKTSYILFPASFRLVLKSHLSATPRNRYLFETRRFGPFTTRRIQQIVQGYREKAGMSQPIHPHLLRHQMLTYLTTKGLSDAQIQPISDTKARRAWRSTNTCHSNRSIRRTRMRPERGDLKRFLWDFTYLCWANPNGEKIASGFVESAINQVVSKRLVKKQQMGWSQRGAHLLLQIRTRVLDEEWENTFRRWYPDFRPQGQAKKAA